VSDVAEAASAVVLVADFAASDMLGKVNALGLGWHVTRIGPGGVTPPQSVVALIEVPGSFGSQSMAAELSLLDAADELVTVPGPDGTEQAVRVAQVLQIPPLILNPGEIMPPDLTIRLQVAVNIPVGVQLAPNSMYKWRLALDSKTDPGWEARFWVVGLGPGPVFG
jgi:hypothetical protein